MVRSQAFDPVEVAYGAGVEDHTPLCEKLTRDEDVTAANVIIDQKTSNLPRSTT